MVCAPECTQWKEEPCLTVLGLMVGGGRGELEVDGGCSCLHILLAPRMDPPLPNGIKGQDMRF